jgi:hypothetical protein
MILQQMTQRALQTEHERARRRRVATLSPNEESSTAEMANGTGTSEMSKKAWA